MPVFTSADLARPGFDLSMELLCCLTPEPGFTRLVSITKDLALENREATHALIDKLIAEGFEIVVTHRRPDSGGAGRASRGAYIKNLGWPKAQAAAAKYWDAVWGAMPAVVAAGGGIDFPAAA